MLKTFPAARFAYAFFVVFAVLENWSVLQSLIDSPEYKVLKASAKPPRRQKLRQFESIVNDSNKKAAGMAAVAVMRPISTALHYLEERALTRLMSYLYIACCTRMRRTPVRMPKMHLRQRQSVP